MSIFTKLGSAAVKASLVEGIRAEVDEAFYAANDYFQETGGDTTEFVAFIARISDPLSQDSRRLLDRKARYYAARYRDLRLYEDDFRSEFNIVIGNFIARLTRNEFTGDNVMRQLSKAFHYRAMSLVRKARSPKHRINHAAVRIDKAVVMVYGQPIPLEEALAAPDNTEKQVLDRMTIAEMATDVTLTAQERALFEYLRSEPDATLQEIATTLGVRDRKQAQRVKNRLADKLRKYL